MLPWLRPVCILPRKTCIAAFPTMSSPSRKSCTLPDKTDIRPFPNSNTFPLRTFSLCNSRFPDCTRFHIPYMHPDPCRICIRSNTNNICRRSYPDTCPRRNHAVGICRQQGHSLFDSPNTFWRCCRSRSSKSRPNTICIRDFRDICPRRKSTFCIATMSCFCFRTLGRRRNRYQSCMLRTNPIRWTLFPQDSRILRPPRTFRTHSGCLFCRIYTLWDTIPRCTRNMICDCPSRKRAFPRCIFPCPASCRVRTAVCTLLRKYSIRLPYNRNPNRTSPRQNRTDPPADKSFAPFPPFSARRICLFPLILHCAL